MNNNKKCNRETNSDVCELCGTPTEQDIPVLIYWCQDCKTPIIKPSDRIDKNICPLCGKETKYMCADIRPVFPEERLLVEILLAKPFAFADKTVWASNNRYYIDGKPKVLTGSAYKKYTPEYISKELSANKDKNNYDVFNKTINRFILANKERLNYLFDEATDFIRGTAQDYQEENIVISFYGIRKCESVSQSKYNRVEDNAETVKIQKQNKLAST